MKLEIIIHHPTGKTTRHLVHKLVRHGDIWTAHYTTVKSGLHVSRKIDIDNVVARLSVQPVQSAAAPEMYNALKSECVSCQLRDHETNCEDCSIGKVLKKARGEE